LTLKNPNRPVVNTLTASFKAILSQGGVTGLYHGITATIIRNIPANACYFGFYELSKSVLIKEGQEATKLKLFLSGGIGGLAYWGLVYPLDFVKTTLQADAILPEKRQWRGMGHVIRATLAAEGIRGFYRGFVPCLARAFPANAACFLAYEQCKAVIASM
jgi:solute carrier family 25 (mitochondrial carnitine/acylcarnitine transporter), member 20/29